MTRSRKLAARRIRSDGWTLPRQRMFLKVLAVSGSVEKACDAAEMSVSAAYRLRLHPDGEGFRIGWANALNACSTSLREIAFDRAINGVVQPIIEKGEIVGRRTVHNDRLLMFLLRQYDHQAGAGPQHGLVRSFNGLRDMDVPDAEAVAHPGEDAETSLASG